MVSRAPSDRAGFALAELLIVVVVIALAAAAGGFYFGSTRSGSGSPPPSIQTPAEGSAAEQAARQAADLEASATAAEQGVLNQLEPTPAPAPAPAPAKSASSSAAKASTDPLASLGSDNYADGVLPLGDGKYVTSGPKKGYIYLCNANMPSGGGAQEDGPWIGASTWNEGQKVAVAGSVTWANASYSMSVANGTRTIVTNDLPVGVPTGIFPIQSTDPAYRYDRNPNSVTAQSLTFSFPAKPVAAAAPSCIGGEVGVMTDGVMLFDGFDAENRDAPAHEVQDKCNGHPQEAGEYHYHGPSACLPNGSTTVIGFAFDGFPITGSKIAADRYLTTADLDECHGITSPVMLDGSLVTMYHYVMTADFPYSVSCFRGTSTVKGPTAGPSSGGGSGGQGGQQTNQGGTPGQPPAAATAACSGSASGASCSFSAPQGGTVTGVCRTPPGQSSLACVPQ